MSETVYLCSSVTNGSRKIHLDRDCKTINHLSSDDVMEKPKQVVKDNIDICSICDGSKAPQSPGNNDHYMAALEAGENND